MQNLIKIQINLKDGAIKLESDSKDKTKLAAKAQEMLTTDGLSLNICNNTDAVKIFLLGGSKINLYQYV